MAVAWNDKELEASVNAYLLMLSNKDKSNKKEIYRELAQRFDRTEKAFEYRMQNISHVLNSMGRKWIAGLKPAKNVGSNIAHTIEKQILVLEGADLSKANFVFHRNALVREFDKDKNGNFKWPYSEGVDEPELGFTEEDSEELEKQANWYSKKQIDESAPAGVLHPKKISSIRTEYTRDSAVVTWVLARSSGQCECCEKVAPFTTPEGTPYLEVHHLRQLAKAGTDRVSNAIAVCPNCHKQLHFGSASATLLESIYKRVPGLVHE